MNRNTIFAVQITWLLGLGALGFVYFSDRPLIPVPDLLGPVPLAVLWFGALGAVVISLTGVVEHAHDWDSSMGLWHLSRPLVGAALGIVAVLILQAGVLAIGSSPQPASGVLVIGPSPQAASGAASSNAVANSAVPKNLLYYLIAFLVGYREETFRELIKRLVDLILAPSTASKAPTITKLEPRSAATSAGGQVVINGRGFTGASAVTFGPNSVDFTIDSDVQITAQLPKVTNVGQVAVTVRSKSGSATTSFKYT